MNELDPTKDIADEIKECANCNFPETKSKPLK